ncbi:Hsp70 family protein [Amycolatopsis sp. K13G38]|uniref:Hsp70 family protein n=1 Tax=Amycolatopsis acididurans TaxID=2724524 RepID=A0ABX1J069_9PSEU|nr:Hsp70 family protein [Amycolatopsis acididurans]NKQ53162.1 Hsp70 family protein [Amycolatopsis acididurans]
MGYGLGIDLGTTFTAAAIDRDGHAEMATLGDRTASIPSVVLLRSDGTVLVGDAADRRAAAESDRVAREFKRRLGDPTPILLGGAPQSVASLMARLLGHVVAHVSERQGESPAGIVLTHPANWGPYKRELFAQVPRLAGLGRTGLITEPEAAAAHYAAQERLDEGSVVAVYDLGGGTFDATVLRKRARGFEILGVPEGIENLGGVDFDEAVFGHVDRALDGQLSRIDPDDPNAVAAVVRLRKECVLAKEALSADTETTIPVLVPGTQTEVRLTRGEFEEMIAPSLAATIQSLRRALASARLSPAEVTAVLLVGGSSRIPLVAQLVSAELGRPVAVDIHPKNGVALGAAALASARVQPERPTEVVTPAEPPPATGTKVMPAAAAAFGAGAPAPVLGKAAKTGTDEGRVNKRRRGVLAGITALAVAAIVGIAVAVSNASTPSGGSGPAPATPPPAVTTTGAASGAAQPVPQNQEPAHSTTRENPPPNTPKTTRPTHDTTTTRPTTTVPTTKSTPVSAGPTS